MDNIGQEWTTFDKTAVGSSLAVRLRLVGIAVSSAVGPASGGPRPTC
jgi:hypothetical protein